MIRWCMRRGLLLLGCALLACGDDPARRPEDDLLLFTDWIRVEAECGYAFRAPPDTMPQDAAGTDSCVERWTTGDCLYSGYYGAFSSDLSEYRQAEGVAEYEESAELIAGQEARLVTARAADFRLAGVHFPQVAAAPEGVGLTVEARCQSRAGQLDARSVFRTITFAP